MELKLQTFIDAMAITSDVDNLSENAPQVMRRVNTAIQKTSTFVIAVNEPLGMILPINVIWLCYDSTSPHYRHALKRISKDADENGKYTNSWEVLYFYEDIWGDQEYDAEDRESLSNVVVPGGATTTLLGLVKLSAVPADALMPVVISEGDVRLTNARDPLPHSHMEIPATQLKHATGIVTIANGTPAIGKCLKALGPNSATWDFLLAEDIQA